MSVLERVLDQGMVELRSSEFAEHQSTIDHWAGAADLTSCPFPH